MHEDLHYTSAPAKYAKGKRALTIPGIGVWKSTAALLLNQIAPNARYSNRERAYIVSPAIELRLDREIAHVLKQRSASQQVPQNPEKPQTL